MNKINFSGGESKSPLRKVVEQRVVEREGRGARMRISAKADYAVRAVLELAAVPTGASLSAREIATAQEIPQNFLENILAELRRAGVVHTHRGPGGGSSLARPAADITVGEILLAIDGPLAAVRDLPPEQLVYDGHGPQPAGGLVPGALVPPGAARRRERGRSGRRRPPRPNMT